MKKLREKEGAVSRFGRGEKGEQGRAELTWQLQRSRERVSAFLDAGEDFELTNGSADEAQELDERRDQVDVRACAKTTGRQR